MKDLEPFAIGSKSVQFGVDSVFITDEDNGHIGLSCNGLNSAGHDGTGRVIAAHRVQRNPHELLLLFLDRDDFSALVVAAIRADAVRQSRLIALRAILDLRRLGMMVAAPVALPGTRRTPLRYGHDLPILTCENGSKSRQID
jgi:hypothetical protein